MRKIAIVGGGQSGLHVACGLLQKGYEVTVVSNRDAESIRQGRVLSSQCMFHTALEAEREIGLNAWEAQCPKVEEIDYSIAGPAGQRQIRWVGHLRGYAQSVDQRVKIPGWMESFVQAGGELRLCDAGIDDLEALAREFELVLVASGKGEIGRLFERDAAHSPFNRPMRALSLTYVHNMVPRDGKAAVCFNVIPGVGEYFIFPALTTSGECEIMVFEGVIDGPMDRCWSDVQSARDHLAVSKWILAAYLPWEAARCGNVELTDDNGRLVGRFAPTVRQPVARLPSGALVMGIADTVVLNDPLTGQGSNNAAKCARSILDAIVARGQKPFDEAWMRTAFAAWWENARWVVKWTNSLLIPPQPPIPELMAAASRNSALADEIANAFDNPRDFEPWFYNAKAAGRKLGEL